MKRFSLLLMIAVFSTMFAFGQTDTGRLTGIISGPDGVLPGATLTLTDNKTGKERTTTTSDIGAYTFTQLGVGSYTLKVTSGGFKTASRTNVDIDVGQEYSLNVTLEIGQ